MDLMPLVQDGVASEDSENAVKKHISECESCKKIYDEMYTNNKNITEDNKNSQIITPQSIHIDKENAVKKHISECESCKKIYDEMYTNNKNITEDNKNSQIITPQSIHIDKVAKKVEKKINKYLGMIIIFGIFFGLSLTASEEMFLVKKYMMKCI